MKTIKVIMIYAMAIVMVLFFQFRIVEAADEGKRNNIKLHFNEDGIFKIVQFTDTQDDQDIEPRTVQLIEAVLENESPELVVFSGDNIKRGPETFEDVIIAINNIASPVDNSNTPWLITFGNHDEDHTPITGVDEPAMLDIYRSYHFNINKPSPKGVHGTGNMNVLIRSSRGNKPIFNVWAIDSGRYAPDEIADQSLEGYWYWDWIRPSQIEWYLQTSEKLEKKNKKKIPSLMFFHIPLFEFGLMWDMDITYPGRHGVVGERNECVCTGPFNSGLYAAILERGDVKGVFVGHDHINNYVGNYYGIYLGYSASTGFGTYGLDGSEKHRLKGARVFILDEDDPENFETYMVYASDYGIDLTP